MSGALAKTRVLVAARFCAYAALVAGAARSPDVPQLVALLHATHPPAHAVAFADPAAATLGWLATAVADAVAKIAGFGGLCFLTAFALTLTLALVEWRARRAASPAIALCASLVGAACMLDIVHVGEGAENVLFFAALLATFDLRGRRAIVCATAVTALWCNVSPEGILAPVFAVAFAMGFVLDRADKSARMHAQLIAVGSALATFATPALIAFPADAWRMIALDNRLNDMLPGAPADAAPLAYYLGLVLTIVVALAIGARGTRTGDTFVFAFAAICAFSKGELVALVGIAVAPVLAEAATRMLNARRVARIGTRADQTFLAQCALSAAIVAVAVGVAGTALPSLAAETAAAPYGVLARYARDPARSGRLLCTKLPWCDVAERTYGIDVVADTRVPSASDATIAAQRTIASAKAGWHAKARALGVGAIFVDRRSGFATLLLADGWRPYGTDGLGALFIRTAATL